MTLAELPNDIDALKQLVLDQHREVVQRDEQVAERDERLAEQQAEIKELKGQLAYLKHKLFGRRSEKIDPNQLLLFNQLTDRVEQLEQQVEQERNTYTRRKGHGRRPLPDDLPVEEVEYPLENTDCPCCGEPMQNIGREVTDEADYNPGSLFIRRHVRPKYACRNCQEGVHIAAMPPRPIDKGLAGPGLLAHVLTSKYSEHIPLNRMQGMLGRLGLDVSVSTLCGWVGGMADLLSPIYDGLRAELLGGPLIQSDATTVPYLLRELNKQAAKGYLWTYLYEPSGIVLYDFTTSQSRAGPTNFLSGFHGKLVTDGHLSYNEVVTLMVLIHSGCWAHARRKFYDARLDDRQRCGRMLDLIGALFEIERRAKQLRENGAEKFGDAEHLALRRAESAPLVAQIRSCVDAWSVEVLPRGPVGKALAYVANQWSPLTRFLEDPTIPLDNNAAERAMRHVVIGRKNWTFAGSVEGGHRAAKIYSIVATCRLNGLDPFVYLRDVIDRLPRGEDPTTLLPAAWKAKQLDNRPSDS